MAELNVSNAGLRGAGSAPVGSGSGSARSAGAADGSGASHVTLSDDAQMVLRIEEIARSHDASARGLLGDLAQKLRGEARQAGKEHLGELANRVQQAAQTGRYQGLVAAQGAPAQGRARGVAVYAASVEAGRALR